MILLCLTSSFSLQAFYLAATTLRSGGTFLFRLACAGIVLLAQVCCWTACCCCCISCVLRLWINGLLMACAATAAAEPSPHV